MSGHIESELTHELTTTDLEAVLDPGSLLPLICDTDDLIDIETDGQTEMEITQVEGQASDVVVNDDIMDFFSDYSKQSNFQLVTYSQSSGSEGSASQSYTATTDEILCDSKDNEQSVFKMSLSLK